ncbi:MAG: hypothetical protein JOS17DRAFT_795708 [Linnemannia elongata]|nr:MAG: hypothetical protein JOS17DRAFT_795708 [Linnemannia elongata]
MEGRIFECDGIQYRFSLVVPLNQTHRTTEPDFEMTCNELSWGGKIFMGVFYGFIGTILFLFVIFPVTCNYLSLYHPRFKVVVANVGAFIWNLVTCWRNPKIYRRMPIREGRVGEGGPSQTRTARGVTSIIPVPSRSSATILPITTSDGPDTTPLTNQAPRRSFFAWTKSLFSRSQPLPTTSETTTTDERPSSTEPRGTHMTESTLTDVEIARPGRSLTWKRETEETLPSYRM